VRVLHYRYVFSLLSETFIYDYVTEQQRQGLDVHVATTGRYEPDARPFEPLYVLPQPPRFNLGRIARRLLAHGAPRVEQRHMWHYYRRGLERLVARLAPDVIHAHFGPDAVVALPVAEKFGVPLVVQFYGYDVSLADGSDYWTARYRELFSRSAAVIALSEEMARELDRRFPCAAKLSVVHLAKRLADYPFRLRTGPIERWITVGRLTAKKGHADAIEAVARLRQSHPALRLTIVGGGEQHGCLKELVRARGLERIVELAGPRPHPEVIQLLDRADAFLLLSCTSDRNDREGTPVVLLEAQAMGLPVVSTRHAGIPETLPPVAHKHLVAERDVDGCSRVMTELMQASPEARVEIIDAARRWVTERYELGSQVARHVELYTRLVRARGRAGSSVHASVL
jgi:glycosyltransferase involved in cell wall biosynthesis